MTRPVFDSVVAWGGLQLRGSARGHRVALNPDGSVPAELAGEVRAGDRVALCVTFGWHLPDGKPVRATHDVLGVAPAIGAVTWSPEAIGAPLSIEIIGIALGPGHPGVTLAERRRIIAEQEAVLAAWRAACSAVDRQNVGKQLGDPTWVDYPPEPLLPPLPEVAQPAVLPPGE